MAAVLVRSQVKQEVNETMMISEYGWEATLLIIYEDRNWRNIIYQQTWTCAFRKHHHSPGLVEFDHPSTDQWPGKEKQFFLIDSQRDIPPSNEMQKEFQYWIVLGLIVSHSFSNILSSLVGHQLPLSLPQHLNCVFDRKSNFKTFSVLSNNICIDFYTLRQGNFHKCPIEKIIC